MRIALYADCGRAVGLGHLGRCVALAQAFTDAGARVAFVDVPVEGRAWLRSQGFPSERLSARTWDLVVGDSYRLHAAGWRRLAAAGRRFLALDDLGTYAGPCDFLLNGHIYAPEMAFRAGPRASLLLGSRFFPLRSEYHSARRRKQAPAEVRNVLVTLGGGGSAAVAERAALETAAALPDAKIELVLGPLAGGARASFPVRVRVYAQVPSLKPLLERADLVVSGGGQTLYEAAYCGAPAIGLELMDNQADNLRGMASVGAACSAGRPSDARFWPRLRSLVRRIASSSRQRARMTEVGLSVVDGQGARRVAAAVIR